MHHRAGASERAATVQVWSGVTMNQINLSVDLVHNFFWREALLSTTASKSSRSTRTVSWHRRSPTRPPTGIWWTTRQRHVMTRVTPGGHSEPVTVGGRCGPVTVRSWSDSGQNWTRVSCRRVVTVCLCVAVSRNKRAKQQQLTTRQQIFSSLDSPVLSLFNFLNKDRSRTIQSYP